MARHLETIKAEEMIKRYQHLIDDEDEQWYGINDAFQPLYDLIEGKQAIIPADLYEKYSTSKATIRCCVSFVKSTQNWGFFAYKSQSNSAPRWNLIDDEGRLYNDFPGICAKLRGYLSSETKDLDWPHAESVFQRFLLKLKMSEREILPNKKKRALAVAEYLVSSMHKKEIDPSRKNLLNNLSNLFSGAELDEQIVDFNRFSEMWLEILQPYVLKLRRENKRYKTVISFNSLKRKNDNITLTEQQIRNLLDNCPRIPTLDNRLTVCIIGVNYTANATQ